MSLKMYFLHSYLDSLYVNRDATRDEHGVRSYQDISGMENTYKGKRIAAGS